MMPRYTPINFTDEMVSAILTGRKTQTRRVAQGFYISTFYQCPYGKIGDVLCVSGSAIYLGISNVKIEKLQEISREDAISEGIRLGPISWLSPVRSFRTLWDSIYAKDPVKCWSANPWVWAIEFKKVDV